MRIDRDATLRQGLLAVFFVILSELAPKGLPLAYAGNDILSRLSGMDVISRKRISLTSQNSKATVLIFLSAKCPCSASHESRLIELYQEFSSRGFQFVGIHSNIDEPSDLTARHFTEAHLPFPVIEDSQSQLANSLGALKTPHVFILDSAGEIVFQGGVDDSHITQTAKKHYLKDALLALSEGKKPEKKNVRTLGCRIQR